MGQGYDAANATRTMSAPLPYAIVLDDHPLVGHGMAQYLQALRPDLTVYVATRWAEAQQRMHAHGCPQMLVADVWLSEGSILKTLTQWHAQCPHTPWLAISGDDDPSIPQRAQQAGAQGFVHKQAAPDVFGQAFVTVLAGGQWYPAPAAADAQDPRPREWDVTPTELGLTLRQGEILALVMRGLPNKRIALMLGVTESTVKEHLTGILERLGVKTRMEALTQLRGRRLVLPHDP
jgi:DNA-binding NarL/FixJ family response regulator